MYVLPRVLLASALSVTLPSFAQGANDSQLQADVQHQLNKKAFRNVHAEVADGAVTLTGSVDLLAEKLDAEKRIEKTHEAAAIHNNITVNAPDGINDQQLFDKLARKLASDREGYPSFPFNSIGIEIQNGVVTLGGEVVEPVDKDSAVDLVSNTPGVRGLVDHLKVAPVSPSDWEIRRAMYRAVYGSPVSTKYAIDPVKPIRIVVDNGHVTLTGAVDNKGDKEIIGMRAQSVPGVFSVNNDLQISGPSGSETSH